MAPYRVLFLLSPILLSGCGTETCPLSGRVFGIPNEKVTHSYATPGLIPPEHSVALSNAKVYLSLSKDNPAPIDGVIHTDADGAYELKQRVPEGQTIYLVVESPGYETMACKVGCGPAANLRNNIVVLRKQPTS